jgi:hypothetical protein
MEEQTEEKKVEEPKEEKKEEKPQAGGEKPTEKKKTTADKPSPKKEMKNKILRLRTGLAQMRAEKKQKDLVHLRRKIKKLKRRTRTPKAAKKQ